MRFLAALLCLAACSTASARESARPPALSVEPYTFTARDGRSVAAERGRFSVPENRADPNSRRIELAFVRFRSTAETPGNPIVYLAGGPGGAGTGAAQGPRFDIFMALRAHADVIAFDQRGTGLSHTPPACPPATTPDAAMPLTRDSIVAHFRADTARCLEWWRAQNVDIAAYNTRESAADIEDLRRAIGAARIDLWAISYGTHLGAAYLRAHDARVGRAVFAGYEGPDDTVKLPSGADAMLARFAQIIAADPAAAAAYPDFLGCVRRVLTRLEREPAVVTIAPAGAPITLTIGAFPVQLLTGGMIADPRSAAQLPAFYKEMDEGRFERAATIIWRQLADTGMRAMPTAMDIASGVSAARLARVQREAQTSLLGDALNFPMPHLLGVAPELDLGDAFRAPLRSRTRILFISGTLDGRTYPEAAREALMHLPNSRQLVVENGGHNIYEADPRMQTIVLDWFRNGSAPERISFAPPEIQVSR
jgi:pimeloyl-ACP methyl ester carboxylesterase